MAAFSTLIKSRHGAKVGPGPWDPQPRSPPQSLKVGPGTSKVEKWDPRTPLRSLKVGLQDPLQSLKVGPPSRTLPFFNEFFLKYFIFFFK